jgi:LmbE family N-acetylglucosaminyl deacetylase
MKKDVLIVVAHPDDETIWMGGTILRNPDWNVTILSLCRRDDADREPKFRKVCGIYGAKPLISDVEDEQLKAVNIDEIKKRILDLLSKKSYDIIFTHGANGEYGHIRHIECHKAVEDLVSKEELKSKNIYYFHYKKGDNVPYPELLPPEPIDNSDILTVLTGSELMKKKKIIKDVYGYPDEKGFELMSCNKMESFLLR